MKPIAYSYQRWSSPIQGKGHSRERQTELAEDYASRHGLVLDTTRNMNDHGVSGYSGKNITDGALGAFIKAIEAGQIASGSYLLVEDIDRLSRLTVMDALAVFQQIIKADVTIVTLRDGQKYSYEGLRHDWTPLMPILFAMARGHGESELKSDRIGKAWKRKKVLAREDLKPHGSNCPGWLDYLKPGELTPDGKETVKHACYKLNSDRTELVRRIFQLYVDGYGFIAIAKMLNDEGKLTWRKQPWNVSSLNTLLQSRSVLGEYQPRNGTGSKRQDAGPAIPNYYPAAIDEKLFYRAQKARESRRKSGASRQPKQYNCWQGVAKCYLCGNALHMVDKGKPPKNHKYLHCYGSKKGLCKAGYLRLELADAAFPEVLAKMNSSFSLIEDSSAELSRELDEIDARISEHQASLRQLDEALDGSTSPTLTRQIIKREGLIADLTKRREELSLALASEAITDKAAFFKALDLVSYEGRNRANALLKELQVTVRIDPANSLFRVMKGDTPAFDLIHTDSGVFDYHPGTNELAGVIQHQEGMWTPRLIVDRDEDDYDTEFESEGHVVNGEY